MDVSLISWDYVAMAWAGLAVITAVIAKVKDRSTIKWLFYGLLLAPIAFLHILTKRTNEIRYEPIPVPSFIGSRVDSSTLADELTKWAELQERGHITKDEFLGQKAKLMEGWPVKAASEPPVTSAA